MQCVQLCLTLSTSCLLLQVPPPCKFSAGGLRWQGWSTSAQPMPPLGAAAAPRLPPDLAGPVSGLYGPILSAFARMAPQPLLNSHPPEKNTCLIIERRRVMARPCTEQAGVPGQQVIQCSRCLACGPIPSLRSVRERLVCSVGCCACRQGHHSKRQQVLDGLHQAGKRAGGVSGWPRRKLPVLPPQHAFPLCCCP